MTSIRPDRGSAAQSAPDYSRPEPGPDDFESPDRTQSNIVASLSRHKWLILACAVGGVLVGLLTATLQPTIYTAESRVFLSSQASFDPLAEPAYANDPSRYLDQQAALMTSRPMLHMAIEAGAEAATAEEFQQSIKVITSPESDVVTIRAEGSSANQAASRVDGIVDAYQQYQKSKVTERLAAIDDLSTDDERREAKQRAIIFGDGIELVEQASVSPNSSMIRNASVLGLVGILLGIALGIGRDVRRARPRGEAAGDGDHLPHRRGKQTLRRPEWQRATEIEGGPLPDPVPTNDAEEAQPKHRLDSERAHA